MLIDNVKYSSPKSGFIFPNINSLSDSILFIKLKLD